MKLALSLFLVISTPMVSAWWSSDVVHVCKTEAEAIRCASTCKKTESSLSFKVSVLNNAVIAVRSGPGGEKSGALKGCRVVDEENWICEDAYTNSIPGLGSTISKSTSSMTNGRYLGFERYLTNWAPELNNPGSYYCLK